MSLTVQMKGRRNLVSNMASTKAVARLRVACGHDGEVGHVNVVKVLDPRRQQENGVQVF